jgi:hypothetical protein
LFGSEYPSGTDVLREAVQFVDLLRCTNPAAFAKLNTISTAKQIIEGARLHSKIGKIGQNVADDFIRRWVTDFLEDGVGKRRPVPRHSSITSDLLLRLYKRAYREDGRSNHMIHADIKSAIGSVFPRISFCHCLRSQSGGWKRGWKGLAPVFIAAVCKAAIQDLTWLFTATFAMPVWLAVLLGSCFLIVLWQLLHTARQTLVDPPAQWKRYRQDIIDGALWEWDFAGDRIVNLLPFCPNDLTPMEGIYNFDGYGNRENYYRCPTCGRVTSTLRGPESVYIDTITRKIQGKINRDDYLQVLETKDRSETAKRKLSS